MVPQQVSFVERSSLSQWVPYRRFHCTKERNAKNFCNASKRRLDTKMKVILCWSFLKYTVKGILLKFIRILIRCSYNCTHTVPSVRVGWGVCSSRPLPVGVAHPLPHSSDSTPPRREGEGGVKKN